MKIEKLFIIILSLLLLTSCLGEKTLDDIGFNYEEGKLIYESDSHGGFHGDGCSIRIYKFSDNFAFEEITSNELWHKMPLPKSMEALIYGIEEENYGCGPFFFHPEEGKEVPRIKNGFWYFLDRSPSKNNKTLHNPTELFTEKDGMYIDKEPILNFTAAFYDINEKLLYILKSDF